MRKGGGWYHIVCSLFTPFFSPGPVQSYRLGLRVFSTDSSCVALCHWDFFGVFNGITVVVGDFSVLCSLHGVANNMCVELVNSGNNVELSGFNSRFLGLSQLTHKMWSYAR